jgi:glutamine cyclotransferase
MTQDNNTEQNVGVSGAEIAREYGPFPECSSVGGVTFDGKRVWFAAGETLRVLEPESGEVVRTLGVAADAGTAFDGRHVYQLAESCIQKIDPATGTVVATIPAPGKGTDSGLTWAEGSLWVGQYRDRKIVQIDPETGAVLRTIESNRFVTGVTWDQGELWHGTWEAGESELRQIDPATGAVKSVTSCLKERGFPALNRAALASSMREAAAAGRCERSACGAERGRAGKGERITPNARYLTRSGGIVT